MCGTDIFFRMRRILLTIIILFLLAGNAYSASQYRSGYKWKTIHTEHFKIHYHQGERQLAYRVAVIAENVYVEITGRFEHKPIAKIEIILSDDQDDSNGSSSSMPVNTVRLYAATPHPSSILDDYDDWMRMLISHELTHTIHIDMEAGFSKAIRRIFGRVVAWNHLSPIFEIEGLAIYHETILSQNGGRAQSVQSEMIVRGEWESGKFPPIDQISTWTSDWPAGYRPYIIGAMFTKWITETYTDEVWYNIARWHVAQPWPFAHNWNGMWATGGTKLTTLYKEWQKYLDQRYSDIYRALEQEGVSKSQKLTKTGNQNRRPRFSQDGKWIYFEENSGHRWPRINRIDVKSGKIRKVIRTEPSGDAVYFPDGRIIVAAEDGYETWKSYYDLFGVNKSHTLISRMTNGLRTQDIALSPDGITLLYVSNELERPTIGLLNTDTGEKTKLYTPDKDNDLIQISQPSFHPDGNQVAFCVWHNDGNRDIFLFEIASKKFTRMTFDAERDINPAFSPDGKYLLFSSGRTGIYNLYALDINNQKLYRITNVFGGAFNPDVSPDGSKVVFAGYGPDGYDIHLMSFDPESGIKTPYVVLENKGFGPCTIGRQIALEAQAAKEKYDESDYEPGSALLPQYWYPNAVLKEDFLSFGFTTGGHDPLGRHSYEANLLYSWDNNFFSYDFAYTNSVLRPDFTLFHSRSAVDHGNTIFNSDNTRKKYWEERLSGTATVLYPFTDHHAGFLQYIIQERRALTHVPNGSAVGPEQGLFSGLRIGYIMDYTKAYRESLFISDGVKASLNYTAFSSIFGADYEVRSLLGTIYSYFGLPVWNMVIAARIVGGYAEGEILYLKAFRLGGFAEDQKISQPTNGGVFLRGYQAGSQRGQRVAAGSLEYRLPLYRPQRGPLMWPISLDSIALVMLGDAGVAWSGELDLEKRDILPSAGGELHIYTYLAYYYPVQLRFGAAWGFIEPESIGGFNWVLELGGTF